MKEVIEFRIGAKDAARCLRPNEGQLLPCPLGKLDVYRVLFDSADPRLREIIDLYWELRGTRKEFYFGGWLVHRSYSPEEIRAAEVFKLCPKTFFEPAGEDCGTIYDASTACPECGVGRTQRSPLVLQASSIPKSAGIAWTIAREIIVSQAFAELLADAQITGLRLGAVQTGGLPDECELLDTPTGRELLAEGAALGLAADDWRFRVWLYRAPRRPRLVKALAEAGYTRRRKRVQPFARVWHQLIPVSKTLRIAEPTRVGNSFYDPRNTRRSECGHVAGLNVLSELSVVRADWDGSDLAATVQTVGFPGAAFEPAPLLVVSPRLRQLMVLNRIRGAKFDIAYLRDVPAVFEGASRKRFRKRKPE